MYMSIYRHAYIHMYILCLFKSLNMWLSFFPKVRAFQSRSFGQLLNIISIGPSFTLRAIYVSSTQMEKCATK